MAKKQRGEQNEVSGRRKRKLCQVHSNDPEPAEPEVLMSPAAPCSLLSHHFFQPQLEIAVLE